MMQEENNIGNIFDVFDETNTDQIVDNSIESPIENPVLTESNTAENEPDDFASSFTDELSVDIESEDNNIEYQSNDDESVETQENPHDLSTVDTEKDAVQPFDAQKIDSDKAMNQGKKPRALNKQGILYIILGAITFIIVFGLFIFPLLNQKKNKKSAHIKKQAEQNESVDYYALADHGQENEITVPEQSKEAIADNKYNDEEGLPPINPKYTDKNKKEKNSYVSGGSSLSSRKEIPDTSEDTLQGKSINGIKGISSSRKNYLSPDTNEQVFTPASPAQQRVYAQNKLPNQAEYTNQLLSQYANSQSSYARQNDQSGKNNFFSQDRGNVTGSYLPLNSIWQGSIFTAILTSNINTDLPGECTAVITKNVYSSQDGSLLLIPQNSKLLGSYNSSISYSQSRVQVGWHTLIRPDGYHVSLGNMSATDSQGASGLKGFINDHPFQYLKALALMSAFSIGPMELKTFGSNVPNNQNNQYVQQLVNDSLVISNKVGEKLIDRALDVQPTITIKSGTKINIVANASLVLPPFEMFEVTQPYQKQ